MRYTETHEWIEQGVNPKKVGITQHAQNELGDIVYVELPKVGSTVKKGQEIAVLESTKAAADVYAPVNGTVVAVNEKLREEPGLINSSPETDGWLYQITVEEGELDSLLTKDAYQAMIGG